jgi:hypothetical protein
MLQGNPGGGYPGAYLGGSPGLTTNLGASRRARQPPGHMTFQTNVPSPLQYPPPLNSIRQHSDMQLSDFYQNNLLHTQEELSTYKLGGYHPVTLGDTFENGRYEIHHKLGFGGFSTVWLAKDRQSAP